MLPETAQRGLPSRVAQQLRGFLTIILLAAAAVSFAVGEAVDGAAIVGIVVLNVALGIAQEWHAEKALAALGRMAAPTARVRRGGRDQTVPARDLVPGDVVLIEAGDSVPAELRLLETVRLAIDESALTGESVPAAKDTSAADGGEAVAHMTTLVTTGRGRGVVTGTGTKTAIGRIATLLGQARVRQTPLQRQLDVLGRRLGVGSLVVCTAILVLGVARQTDIRLALAGEVARYLAVHRDRLLELFMTSISLAVAAIPEGLPAVVTISLALGMQRMARRNALVRRLPAVETLGSATVICSDKTGTLTQNLMAVVRGWTAGGPFEVTGTGYVPEGALHRNGAPLAAAPDVTLLLTAAAACNDARLDRDAAGDWRVMGDPTEGALLAAAGKVGITRDALAHQLPRVSELPFDSTRKRMSTVHEPCGTPDGASAGALSGSPAVLFAKGAPDTIVSECHALARDGKAVPLSASDRHAIEAEVDAMARAALRVLAIAYRPLADVPVPEALAGLEHDLILLGLVAMHDPVRPEVVAAIARARSAGLRTVMITGDHRDTALAVGAQLGLHTPLGPDTPDAPPGGVLSGDEIERLSGEALARAARTVHTYARVSPEHKVRIVAALQSLGHVVAMTGDGVNDAPALRSADIGVAMGRSGTDVSRAAADIVLVDDNYASIVAAVEEGRTIYANIRRFVAYLLSCNLGEILAILVTTLLGLPLPLRPIQLLWLNLVTDGAPAIALGVEPGDSRAMTAPPRPPRQPIVDRRLLLEIGVQAIVTGLAVVAAFALTLSRAPENLALAQTAAFATLTVSELLRAFTARSDRFTVLELNPLGNRWLAVGALTSALLLAGALYVPALRGLFGTVPLSLAEWATLVPFMLATPVAADLSKLAQRVFTPRSRECPALFRT